MTYESVPQACNDPTRPIANVFVREREYLEAAQRQFGVALGVALPLTPAGMRTVSGELNYEIIREECVDSGYDTTVRPERLLQIGSRQSRIADDANEPPLQPALSATVDESIEQDSATIRASTVPIDHPRSQSLLGQEPSPDC